MKRFVIVGFLTLVFYFQNGNCQSAKVLISDANFRTFLNSSYSNCMDASGDSLIRDSAKVVSGVFDCSSKGISSLSGIEYFINISYLYCYDNHLTGLPDLTGLTNLIQLLCEHNQLTEMPELSANTDLEWLTCGFNKLTSLPDLSANTNLQILGCQNNQLTSLPDFSANTKIQIIDCQNNQLTSLPNLSNSADIIELNCFNNLIESLPNLSSNTKLRILDCSINRLARLPDLANNTALEYLYCNYNQLENIPDLSTNTILVDLECYSNRISSLPDLSLNTSLKYLYCSNNLLTSLPNLYYNVNLQELSFGGNQFKGNVDLSANVNLKILMCEFSLLTELPDLSANTELTHIYCRSNLLTWIPNLSNLKKLIIFDCRNNYLDFTDAKNLRIVDTLSSLFAFDYEPQYPFGFGDTVELCPGDVLNLSIGEQDSATHYQWFKNDVAIEGATEIYYLIPKTTKSDQGVYTCKSYGTALASPPMKWGPGITEFVSKPFVVTIKSPTFTELYPVHCINSDSIILTGIPEGGLFEGDGVYNNTFYPDSAGKGKHSISYTYTYPDECVSSDTQEVEIIEVTINGLVSPVCLDSSPLVLSGSPEGGIFNGPGIIENNIFSPGDAGVGVDSIAYIYEYSVPNIFLSCSSSIQTITVENCINSVETEQSESLKVYPNPTNRLINIEDRSFQECGLYNSIGAVVIHSENRVIDLSVLEPGQYFLKIKLKDGSSRIEKIVLINR
jgi:Leucine-rich repeat (LRR) protein